MLHRPLWTWRTVDARVRIDRYENEQRSVWDDFLNAFTQFSQCFCPILSMFLPNYSPTFTRNIHYFNITMPLVLRYIDPYFLKPYSYNNTFLTTLFKTTLFKMIHTGFTQSDILKNLPLRYSRQCHKIEESADRKRPRQPNSSQTPWSKRPHPCPVAEEKGVEGMMGSDNIVVPLTIYFALRTFS